MIAFTLVSQQMIWSICMKDLVYQTVPLRSGLVEICHTLYADNGLRINVNNNF
jgi:hypothetical protein